ncbi:hypothetical protein V6N13_021574 [Hibiscus sabdariffa]
MFVFLKSLSRSAHEEEHHGERSASTEPCTSLTVWRRSLVMSCNGFTVIDCHGDVVYRVDNYSGRPKELVLMDGSGRSILQCDVARVFDETKRVVAEIKRKDAIIGGVSFGAEVFMLIVEAGFDPGFAMALVLLLDQMFS